jgi:glycosyltransferase involved in cell wall biosynthesis
LVALSFAVPGSIDQPTGGYAYDRRIIAALRGLGCEVDIIDLGDGFPYPDAATRRGARERLGALPPGRPVVIDGLALGVLPEAATALAATHMVVALVHHPLALETGISPETAAVFAASERAALAAVRHVVVTSPSTRRVLIADYGVADASVTVALPGNDPVAATVRPRRDTVALLAVGAVVPRKGYDVLVDALAALADLDWRLVIAGDCTRDRATADALAAQIEKRGLDARVRMLGAVGEDELAALHRGADLFVLASRHEGYGMAFAAAVCHGLPVVGTRAGAIPETVPAEAGILVPPDDPAALAAALRAMIADPGRREAHAAAARAAAAQLPEWDATAGIFLRVLKAVT